MASYNSTKFEIVLQIGLRLGFIQCDLVGFLKIGPEIGPKIGPENQKDGTKIGLENPKLDQNRTLRL